MQRAFNAAYFNVSVRIASGGVAKYRKTNVCVLYCPLNTLLFIHTEKSLWHYFDSSRIGGGKYAKTKVKSHVRFFWRLINCFYKL